MPGQRKGDLLGSLFLSDSEDMRGWKALHNTGGVLMEFTINGVTFDSTNPDITGINFNLGDRVEAECSIAVSRGSDLEAQLLAASASGSELYFTRLYYVK